MVDLPTGADIQVENGQWFKLHNTITDVLAVARFTAAEFRAILFLLRKTYGFQKKEDAISISQWAEGTDTDKGNITHVLDSLIEKKVIYRRPSNKKAVYVYGFNKYVEQWDKSIFGRTEGRKRTAPKASQEAPELSKDTTVVSTDKSCTDAQQLCNDTTIVVPTHKEKLYQRTPTKDSKDKKDNSQHQELFVALAGLCKLDMKLKGGQIGKTAKELIAAGYGVGDLELFGKWWPKFWMGERGNAPTLSQVKDRILEAKEAAVTGNGRGGYGTGKEWEIEGPDDDKEIAFRRKLREQQNAAKQQST